MNGRRIAHNPAVSPISIKDPHDELLHRIVEISSLREQIEDALHALVQQHGERSEPVASARALEVSISQLKRELLQHYLECRILEAARANGAINN
jgi:hypothetical protein